MPTFELTPRQREANALLASPATHILLYGGSRSGKTFLETRAIATRAIKAPKSRHAILRFRFNAVVASIVEDTWPKMMELCFPNIDYDVNRSLWFARLQNDSQIWFGGLDDKERTEKILGQEYVTLLLNEISQIPWASRGVAITRLAQHVMQKVEGMPVRPLPLKAYYDENPPDKGHWSYRLFVQKVDPETREPIRNPNDYAHIRLNPTDNQDNLSPQYLKTLEGLSARLRRRFLEGEFKEENPNALFAEADLDKWRVIDTPLPDMQRIIVAVDPSGSGDTDNADNDAIGIVVAGLGTDGNGYLLEDLTVKAGPATWGKVATNAYERHKADGIVAEVNFGGAMVRSVIQAARPRTPYRALSASRGKVVRAEPISSLTEQGKIRLVGYFPLLEDELSGFTTNGYIGGNSPNRGDAFVWAFTELFPGLTKAKTEKKEGRGAVQGSWMS
jgi:predicted phage terminase large subunit-like protein